MDPKFEPPSTLNKFGRFLFGLHPSLVADLPPVVLTPTEVEQVGLEIELTRETLPLNMLFPLSATIITLHSGDLFLEAPREYKFHYYNIILDIPGLRQFSDSLLLNIPGQYELDPNSLLFYSTDVEPTNIQYWPEVVVENIVHLLTDVRSLWIESPELCQFTDELLKLPNQQKCEFTFLSPQQEDFADIFRQIWQPVVVEDMFSMLKGAGYAGKTYDTVEDCKTSPKLSQKDLELCKHGLTKISCEICIEEKAKKDHANQPKPRVINPFDLLLPFLYPPLGINFDNALIFPPGKNLYDFQREGIRFLATHNVALLGDEMGLGKSIQAIFAMRLLLRKRPMNSLILCPKSVLRDWERKLKEWSPELRTVLIAGNQQLRLVLWNTPTHIYLASYDTLTKDINELPSLRFNIVILDEAQNIKNPTTKKTKVVRQIEGEWRWALSGTPLENKVEDLISIFAYLKPKLLTYEDANNLALLQQKIKDYFLRRRMKEVRHEFNLDEPIRNPIPLELTPEQRTSYERTLWEARESLRRLVKQYSRLEYPSAKTDLDVRGKTLAQIHRLKQICNLDPATGKSCKADYIFGKLEEIQAANEKSLIFSQYPKVSLKPLADRFTDFRPLFFDGSLSDNERDTLIEQFQQNDEAEIMLMSVKAGGVGITLTRANHIFFLDQWWNPATTRQAEGRSYRIGQDKIVFIEYLYVANTIEEGINEILKHKQQLFDMVIDDLSEKVLKSITTEELLELFDLVVFDVQLVKPGREIGKTIQVVSEVTKLDYLKARHLVQKFPSTLLEGISREVANRAKDRLEDTGAIVAIQSRPAD